MRSSTRSTLSLSSSFFAGRAPASLRGEFEPCVWSRRFARLLAEIGRIGVTSFPNYNLFFPFESDNMNLFELVQDPPIMLVVAVVHNNA
jgi:hypothetical protein